MPKRRPLLRPASPLQAQLRLVSLLDQLAVPSDRQRNPDELARRLGLPAATVPTLTRAGALWHHGKGRWHVPPSLHLPEVLAAVLPELWPRDFGAPVLPDEAPAIEPAAAPEPKPAAPAEAQLFTLTMRLEHLPALCDMLAGQLDRLAERVGALERRLPGTQPSLFHEPQTAAR